MNSGGWRVRGGVGDGEGGGGEGGRGSSPGDKQLKT